jgi:hypothetical protein
VPVPGAKLKAVDGKIKLHVALELPEGYKINPLAPLRYLVESEGDKSLIKAEALGKLETAAEPRPTFDIELPVTADAGTDKLKVSLAKAGTVTWTLPVILAADAPGNSVRLPLVVK